MAVSELLEPPEELVGQYEMKYYKRNPLPYRHLESDVPLGACSGNGVPTSWEVTGGRWALGTRRDATWTLDVFILCEENGRIVQRISQPQTLHGHYVEQGSRLSVELGDDLAFTLQWDSDAGTLTHEEAGSLWIKQDLPSGR